MLLSLAWYSIAPPSSTTLLHDDTLHLPTVSNPSIKGMGACIPSAKHYYCSPETRCKSKLDARCLSFLANRMPLELICHIICFLRGDTQSLWKCLRVCRKWYSFVIAVLYADITICSRRQLISFARLLRQKAPTHPFPLCTQSLSIYQHNSDVSFMHIAPPILRNRLSKVEHLTLGGHVRGPTSFAVFIKYLHQSFPSVTQLNLRNFTIPNFTAFRRILHAFPKLSQLQISFMKIPLQAPPQNYPYRVAADQACCYREAMPKLESLSITNVEPATLALVVRWLIELDLCSKIHSLYLEQDFLGNTRDIAQLLKALPATMQSLRLMDRAYGQQLIFTTSARRVRRMEFVVTD